MNVAESFQRSQVIGCPFGDSYRPPSKVIFIRSTRIASSAAVTTSSSMAPRGPIEWLSDNEGIYTALDTVIEAERLGLAPITTPVASPESNGMAEALVNTLKRDYVVAGDLSSAGRVLEQIPGWIEDYNTFAPHSSLDLRSSAAANSRQLQTPGVSRNRGQSRFLCSGSEVLLASVACGRSSSKSERR